MAKTLIGNIKGPQGEPGPQGPQGLQGIQGPQGERGPQGLDVSGVAGQFIGFSAEGEVVAMDVPFKEGAASANRALISDADGKLSASDVTATELGYLDGVTSNVQEQINTLSTSVGGKQATITGGVSSVVSTNFTANRALVSNASGKAASSAVTATELGYLSGVTSNVQTQLDAKHSGTLGVEQGGTGATTFTSGRALIGAGTGAVTTRAITNNTANTTAITGSTNLVTMNTLRYALNRTTGPGTADTNYGTYMMRAIAAGTSDLTAGTSTLASGAIYLVYE